MMYTSTAARLEDRVEFPNEESDEVRCPCVLLLDTSGSMQGAPIAALNEGLQTFRDQLAGDRLASLRVEMAVVTFDSQVTVAQDFVTADRFVPPTLSAQGGTAMGAAILQALDMVQQRKKQYKELGISYYRPWIFLITDGAPGDREVVEQAARRLKDEEENRRVCFFAVGVEQADMECLGHIAVRTPLKLNGLNFREMFVWLRNSLGQISRSQPGEQVPLSPPGWGTA